MKQQLIRFMSLMLIVVLIAGCSGNSGGNTGTNEPANGNTGTAENSNSESAPASSEPVALEVFALTSDRSGQQQNWWTEHLKEKVGVTLDFIPSGDQGLQKLQALMAGGELPDIVVFNTKKQVEDAVKADMLVNLDEHIDKLPNVAKHAEKALQYYRDTASNGKGGAYAVPTEVGPVAMGKDLNWGPYLRWDLYKQLGMPEINTVEDYLPLLKKMQELEPTNADGQKVYGLTLWKDWDGSNMQQASTFTNMFGIDTGDQLSEIMPFTQLNFETGELKSIFDEGSEYIRALKFYFTANQMGLVDPDSLTQRFENANEKVAQGRVLFAWWPWFGFNYNTGERITAETPTGFQFVPSKQSKITVNMTSNIGDPWAYAIGKSTKNLDAALKLLDYLYSLEGNEMRMNGPKGVIWDTDDKGVPYITEAGWDILRNQKELPGGGKISDSSALFNANPLSAATVNPETDMPMHMNFWQSSMEYEPTNLEKDWAETTGYKWPSDMIAKEKLSVPFPQAIRTIPTIPDDMSAIQQRIGDVVKTNSWLAIFAKNEAEFQKHIDEMKKKAEGLGLQQIMDMNVKNWAEAQEIAKKYE